MLALDLIRFNLHLNKEYLALIHVFKKYRIWKSYYNINLIR